MKNLSIRRVVNLFSKKNLTYTAEYSTNHFNCDILLGSCINIPVNLKDSVSLFGSMSQLVLKFTYNNMNGDDIKKFHDLCLRSSVPVYNIYDDIYNGIVIASSYDNLAYLVVNGHESDNCFIGGLNQYLSYFLDNRYGYANDEYSYELVNASMSHKTFRRAYDKYISKPHNSTIEILGYSWIDDRDVREINTNINCIWLSIDESIQNEFISVKYNSYREEESKRVLLKIDLIEFIKEMNVNVSAISEETFATIKNIFDSDKEYFKPIYDLINWNGYEYSANTHTTYTEDDMDDEYEEEEISQDEFINSVLDEIIK